jgi:hypothetical protein
MSVPSGDHAANVACSAICVTLPASTSTSATLPSSRAKLLTRSRSRPGCHLEGVSVGHRGDRPPVRAVRPDDPDGRGSAAVWLHVGSDEREHLSVRRPRGRDVVEAVIRQHRTRFSALGGNGHHLPRIPGRARGLPRKGDRGTVGGPGWVVVKRTPGEDTLVGPVRVDDPQRGRVRASRLVVAFCSYNDETAAVGRETRLRGDPLAGKQLNIPVAFGQDHLGRTDGFVAVAIQREDRTALVALR